MSTHQSRAATVRPGDMAPLAERMAHLQVLRLTFAAAVIAGTGLVPGRATLDGLTGLTLAYLALTACVEVLRRVGRKRRLAVVAVMLLLDGVYLATAIHMTGTTESPFNVLVYVHLIAVTLLASYRTGLKLALWHSLLILIVYSAEASGAGPRVAPAIGAFAYSTPLLNMGVLWLVSISTAVYSSLNERELRRNRAHLETLAELARELESSRDPEAIAGILLSKAMDAFGFVRGVVMGAPLGKMTVLAGIGDVQDDEAGAGANLVIRKAWEQNEITLVKRLDPLADAGLSAVLPQAQNLVVASVFDGDRPIGALILEASARGTKRIEARTVSMIAQLSSQAALALRNAWLLQQLRKMAETDPLTEIANRRTLKKVLDREVARALRRSEQMALVMLDLDHFKAYNDKFGHQAGDDLLRATGRALKEVSREYDTVARYGGEEFAVVLPASSPSMAQELGDRLRESICHIEAQATVTASAGVAIFPLHGRDPDELIRAADGALYESKRRGRDRVTLARAGSGALATTSN
jgi:diguanylate cyclase (GGDEF)-like protein